MSVPQFFQYYKDKGFNFSNKVLTKYCLSLYTKPFVILSGISGTGKTKIAQLFEVFVDTAVQQEPVQPIQQNFGYVIMNVTDGILNGDGRGNLKFSDLAAIFEQDEIPVINEKIKELKRRNDGGNITDPELFIIETAHGEFKAAVYLQRAESPLLRVRFKSKRGDRDPYDSQAFLKDNFSEGDVLKLTKISRRRLRLDSLNDVQVRAVDEILDRRETELVNNKLFVSVKSNWTDNTELLGYYNILEEKYNLTPVLKFMLTAREHPSKPFFLILDEMNLSKVEHYFSDFLSCLESRIEVNGSIMQEPIRLHNYSSFVESNDFYFDLVSNTIDIPFNLFVTGTVNIDETTYAFSPKVLDRANVIEFNDVSISSYDDEVADDRFTLSRFPEFGRKVISTSHDFIDSPDAYKKCITDLLNILQPYTLHFGYRVINEMALFVNNAKTYVGDTVDVINDAVDIQIAQKVLPKFSGAFGKLDEPLRKLIQYMVNEPDLDFKDINIDYVATINPLETAFPESLTKICRLYKNLIFNGFASFLE